MYKFAALLALVAGSQHDQDLKNLAQDIEKDLKNLADSWNAEESVNIWFVNTGDKVAELVWWDFDGNPQSYGQLQPGEGRWQ